MSRSMYDVTEQLLEYGSEVGQWEHLNFLDQVVAKWAYQVSRGSVTPGVVLHLGDMIVEVYDVTQYKGTMQKDDGTYFEVRLPVSLAVEFIGRSRWGIAYKVVGSCLHREQVLVKAKEVQAKLDAEVDKVELMYHDYVEGRPGYSDGKWDFDGDPMFEDEAEVPWDEEYEDPDAPVKCTICGYYHGEGTPPCAEKEGMTKFEVLMYHLIGLSWGEAIEALVWKARWELACKLFPYKEGGDNNLHFRVAFGKKGAK